MGKLNEHLWSGIIHRSETGESRKENDVDFLDMNSLLDYIQKRYDGCYGFGNIGITFNESTALRIYVGFSLKSNILTQVLTFYKDKCNEDKCRCVIWPTSGEKSLNTFLQEREYETKTDVTDVNVKDIETNRQFLKLLDDYIEWCDEHPEYAPSHIQKKKER
jgi:hypothetical protein